MRIVAGRFGGRRLQGPRHAGLRPTAERVRESIFNILAPRIPEARVLDLFAGTGALGLEALSRGAARATFVERDRKAAALLQSNLSALGLAGAEAAVIQASVERTLPILAARGEQYDLILADPPYAAGLAEQTLNGLVNGRLLAVGGVLVFESGSSAVPAAPESLSLYDRRVYGDSTISFLCWRGETHVE